MDAWTDPRVAPSERVTLHRPDFLRGFLDGLDGQPEQAGAGPDYRIGYDDGSAARRRAEGPEVRAA